MSERLTDEYLDEIRKRKNRYMGQWTGTNGAMAADCHRLLTERELLLKEIKEMQDELDTLPRAAHAALEVGPTDTTSTDDIPVDWILRGERALKNGRHEEPERRPLGAGVINAQPDVFLDNARQPGTTAKFGTGAIRSDTFEEFRYDLVSPIGLREVARACAEGAEKYGDWNWEKGMPVNDLLNHALAHVYKFLSGDRSEPHLGHAAWNMLAAIHSHELWPELNAGKLRGPNCAMPSD